MNYYCLIFASERNNNSVFIARQNFELVCSCVHRTRARAGVVTLVLAQIVVQVLPASAKVKLLTLLGSGVVVPAGEGAAARPDLHGSHAVIWWDTIVHTG